MAGAAPARLPPGSVIGILGGGQLGRMAALAAAELGSRVHVFCPEADAPAAQVSSAATVGEYTAPAALVAFADAVDVATDEFENSPLEAVRAVAERVPVRPGPEALEVAQDRLKEKDFLSRIGVPVTGYRPVGDPSALATAVGELGVPAILKTTRFGYDGKGQRRIETPAAAVAAWRELDNAPTILEAFVDFEREISVVLARAPEGTVASYVPVENRHVHHILDTTIAPAPVSEAIRFTPSFLFV